MSSHLDVQQKMPTPLTIQLPNWAWFKLFLAAFFDTPGALGMFIVLGIPGSVAGVIGWGYFTHWLVNNGFLYRFGGSIDGSVALWCIIQLVLVLASIFGICAAVEACEKVERQLRQQQARAQKQKPQQQQEQPVQIHQ